MAKIFITGISGFIGSELARQLIEAKHDVTGNSLSTKENGYFQCDLRDLEATKTALYKANPDIIIHTAALSSVTLGHTMDYYESNVLATENVINAINALGSRKRFVFISTAGVYGNQATDVLTEDLPPLPVSHYGMSKFVCERMVANVSSIHDTTIVRPFNIIGPKQNVSFIAPKLVEHFAKRLPSIRLGNLDPVRDYIDVQTTCKAIIDLTVNSKTYGEIINLCAGTGTSVRDLLRALHELTGHEIEVIAAPEFTRTSEVWKLLGSTKKINSFLPYEITSRPLLVVLKEMLEAAKVS